MAKTKNDTVLMHSVAAGRWARVLDRESPRHGSALSADKNWKSAETYTCPELQHRSAGNQPPSLVMGQRVSR